MRRDPAGREDEDVVIPLSAAVPEALWDLCRSLRDFLAGASDEMDLRDVAYTAGARRGHHDHRLALVVSSRDEAIEALDSCRRGEPHWSIVPGRRPRARRPGIVFVFPGADGLWRGVGCTLFHREPAFRTAIERCDAVLSRHLGWSPAAELSGDEPLSRIGETAADRAIQFALQVALAALWESWGVTPNRVVGDGIGQLAAAYVGGTMSLEDAARIAAGVGPETARFSDAIAAVANDGFEVFLEVGPHPVLASAIKQCLGSRERAPLILASLRRGDAGLGTMRSSAASLYARGFDIEWSRVSPAGRFVRLPGYPWQRERFWLDQEDKRGKSRAEGQPDQIDGDPRPVPHHQNGVSNGLHAAPIEGQPAVVANHDNPAEPPPAIPQNRVAAHLGEVRQEGLSTLPDGTRRQRLMEYFRERVAVVLGLDPDKVDPDRPLLSLGLDSLSAMDLKVEIDAGLRTALPLSMLMEVSGIRELAEWASERLAGSPTGSSEPAAPAETVPALVQADPPLSHGQQMLWYAHQFTTTGAAYHVLGAGSVRAELDKGAFRRAMRRVIARQEALRTTFVLVDEKPAVRLLDVSDLALREDEWLPIEDVAGSDDARLQERLAELAHRPFDLERGPLFRVHVLSRSASEHVLLLVFHHIIADFWSTAVFLDDFKTAYTAECAGRSGELPPPVSSYAKFARWQHEMVAGLEGERHWEYWRHQLARPLPVLDLPTDFARPAVQSYQGAVKHFYLDPTLTRALIALGESHGASLYTVLLAAFQALLARYSGQADIVVGTPVAGRTRPGLHDLVGYFVNLLPMRGDLSGNPTFDEYLGRVRRTVSDGLEHQDFPFGLLVHRLQGNPDPSRPPLFQVMFAHQKIQPLDDQGLAPFALGIPGARLDLHGLAVESIAFARQTALFDLTMMTARDGDRLCVALEYSTDLFKSSTIDRMADGFRNLLEAIIAEPGRRLADLALFSGAERHQLLGVWAAAPAIPHEDSGIHHRFERQVELSPDAVALVWGEESLTYRDLNRLSNSLAHRLIELGVTPETVVGLYLDRWPSRVIGLLGVLKAGGAYLPLDPDHPAQRLAAMLEDSGASFLVTEDHLRDRFSGYPAIVVALDPLAELRAGDEPANPGVHVDGGNLAYVVFTSGSTGRPKGVMVSHRSLLAAAVAWEHAYHLRRPTLRHLQAAGFAFDVFTGDWVRALTTGGTLVACPRAVLFDPAALADLIRREGIECAELVPALADALATHLERQGEDLGDIRLLAVGSDTVRGRLYRRLCRLVRPGGRVVNSYGLTEATIDSTYFGGAPEELEGEDSPVPIGRPLPGTRTYVLDERREPVPVGMVGELYIGGSGVARAYVSNPRQTAEQFVPDPHDGPGSRMYATGDRARWREGGVLELLGRRDGQVKVRGFRVEVGEVEAVLARYPGVSEAVVVVVDSVGDRRLVAYLVPGTLSYPTTSDLRRWLKDRLPEPMVPSSYVFLEALPLSPNGKLDRSALRPPATVEGDSSATEYVPPRTTAEEILAGIAADLLGRSCVGVHDNFFEIGVDSILGIQLVSRARQAGLALGPAHLFRHPNIAELAAAAESNSDDQGSSGNSTRAVAPFELTPDGIDLEAVERAFADHGGIEDLYPLTPMQEGMLFHALADPEAGHYVEQFVCRLRGELDPSAFQESWNRLVARHAALRTTIHWIDFDRPYQVVHRPTNHPVEYQDWRGLTPTEQDERLIAYLGSDRRRGFVLSQPPLSRLTLLKVGENVHQLIWSIHHAVIDGWCLSVLLHEFLDIDESIRRGREPALKPTRPFRDYVAWLRDRDDAPAQGYWRQALKGFTAATPLGLEGLRSARRGTSCEAVAERETVLPADVTARLQALARSGRLTLSTLIQGAWALLLSRYSGRSDVLFGVTVSGRPAELSGVESMVGMFINSLPLRVAVNEEAELVPWLRQLQATIVELRRFEAIPLSRIQAWSEVPVGKPLFESIVIVENLPFVASLQERADRLGIESARYLERTHYPLAITVVPGAELGIKIGFDSDRFDPSAVERTLGHLRTVLEAMTAGPDRRLLDLPLMTQADRHRLLVEWNHTARAYPADRCVHQLFEEQVERTPEAAAVVFENQQLTYRELNARSNQVAHYLRDLGVGPETLVGICVERSLEMVVGLLGILKAGGAYVPLDPEYPAERLAFLLRDSAAPVLLTRKRQLPSLPDCPARVLCLDADASTFADMSDANPAPLATPDNLAYVIYTSGSTGVPKGVLVSHDNVVRLFRATQPWFDFDRRDVWTLFHSFAFDFSVWEIWGALIHGGRLVVVPAAVTRSPREFYQLLLDERVTVLNQTPSAFRPLIAADQAARGAGELSLRLVIFGGEALELESLRPWFLHHGDQKPQLVNMYGITETTVHVTYRPLRLADLDDAPGSVIGRPIPDLRLYVLQSNGQPAPPGVPGEICVGGAGVARGYLNRPELTAEKFIPDPFRGQPEARLYRSGDLARYLPDGDIVYLGRIDQQVKIRGYRIELGEVEAVLGQHPQVRDRAVVARQDISGENRLVAYVVPRDSVAFTYGQLRDYLKPKLPAYMIPSALVVLDSLPLTANGKLDRRAFPEPSGGGAVAPGGYTAPRTEVEEKLAIMWAEALGLERVGIHDNFFELGGHSLMATGLFTRIEAAFERSVPLAILFRAQTVSEMAAVLIEAPELDPRSRIVTLRTGDSRRLPLFLVHGISGNHLVWHPLINHFGADRPVHGLTLPEKNGVPQPFSDIEALAAYQVEQMCAVEPKGPYHIAGYCAGAQVALEIAQQLVAGGREVGLLGAIDSGPLPQFRSGELSSSHLRSFTRNLYYWLIEDFLVTHPRELLARAYRRLKWAAERVRIVPTSPLHSPLPPALEFLDMKAIPSDLRRVVETSYQARMAYKPRTYAGRVTLFRASYGPLFHPLEYDLGWGRFALGGVEILTVRGNHQNIMLDPRVQALAFQLRKCLEEADQSSLAPRRVPSLVDIAAMQPKPKDREQLVRAGRR